MKVFTKIPDGVALKKGDEFKCPTLKRWLPLPDKDFGRVTYNGSGAYRRPGRVSFPKSTVAVTTLPPVGSLVALKHIDGIHRVTAHQPSPKDKRLGERLDVQTVRHVDRGGMKVATGASSIGIPLDWVDKVVSRNARPKNREHTADRYRAD